MSTPVYNKRTPRGMDRRNFLRTGAASAVLLGSGIITHRETSAHATLEAVTGAAQNVILLVSDGMSSGTLAMADLMLRRRDGRPSHWIRLYEENRVRRGLMDMASLDSIVTDSAAASASWGGGHRVNNNALNVGPDGEIYKPILKIFKDSGKATGLVTTTRITHATPAGFAANVPLRYMEDDIAAQYLERGYDLLLGGGDRHFHPLERNDGRDFFEAFRTKKYHVVTHKKDLFNLPADNNPALGLFHRDHLPYTLDHMNTPQFRESIPTLAEMTQIALNRLSRNRNGFILQIEGGRVDHAAHRNDVGGLIYDQIAFDDAVGTVIEFAEQHPDTLVIITTDHGNANPGVNAAGQGYRDSNVHFDSIQKFTYTNDWILTGLSAESTPEQIRERVEEATRHQITGEEAETLRSVYRNEYTPLYREMRWPSSVLGTILANYTSVNWIGGSHTSDYVELAAFGPGSEAIGSFTRNTDLFKVMVAAAGVEAYVPG